MMPRLLVHVEGLTEESFVNEVLAPHLYQVGYESVAARLLGNARQRQNRGGISGWSSARSDLINHLRQGFIVTTMVDYYALPTSEGRAWPGRAEAPQYPLSKRADIVEQALHEDLLHTMGGDYDSRRFIPFIVIHEFEGLLFSDCTAFSRSIYHPELRDSFQAIRDAFNTPEEINDSPITAPSKRIKSLIPNYQKPLLGTFAVLEIGLPKIRQECPHFDGWLTRLEKAINENRR